MISIFVTILNMNLTASVIVLSVLLIRMLLKKAPTIVSYLLWSVVLIRLVFLPSVEKGIHLDYTLQNIEAQYLNMNITNLQEELFHPISTYIATQNTFFANQTNINFDYRFFQLASLAWFVGFVLLLVYGIVGYIHLKRRVYFATLMKENIFVSDKIKTAFVLGIIRPKIYFPTNIDKEQYNYILKHEQIHIKRRDYLIKPFAYVVLTIHWFNPLIWLSYVLMSKDMEMSCDEAVLRNTTEDIRKEYASSLLDMSTHKKRILSPIAFGEGNVKKRVMNVLNFNESKKWLMVVSIVTVCVFVVGIANIPTFAVLTEPNQSNEDIYENTLIVYSTGNMFESILTMTNENSNTAIYTNVSLNELNSSDFSSDFFDEVFLELSDFGVVFDESNGNIYYKGQLVRSLFDFTEDDDGIFTGSHIGSLTYGSDFDIHTVRDENDVIIGVRY